MSNTQYMRSVNDYSLSAHEIYTNYTGKRFPKFTAVSSFLTDPDEPFEKYAEIVYNKFKEHGYSIVDDYSVSFDDGPAKSSNAYTIYEQRFYTIQGGNGIERITGAVLEIYRRGNELIVLTLSPIDLKPIINDIGSILNAAYTPETKPQVFYTIAQSVSGFELEEMHISTEYNESYIDCHYNDDFKPVHDVIVSSIEQNRKGLILLHGIPGAGKTSYIEQLISKGSKRKLVYIPPHLASSIASPTFISFVREELKSCVLVIEDAEEILRDRKGLVDSTAVSNLLNISDGILGKALNILIIATFNMDKEFIDPALLRKGRLIAEYRFEELSKDKATALVKKLHGEDAELPTHMERNLANIFNMDVVQYRAKETPKVTFGFVPGK